jgi:hypothetical protein
VHTFFLFIIEQWLRAQAIESTTLLILHSLPLNAISFTQVICFIQSSISLAINWEYLKKQNILPRIVVVAKRDIEFKMCLGLKQKCVTK